MKFTFTLFLFTLALTLETRSGELKIEGRVAFVEGPAWSSDANVFFTDIENNRIMRRDPSGTVQVYRQPSGRANGLAFDSMGLLHACEGHREGGNRRITRTEKDGRITILTDRYNGRRYNSPNDLVIDSKGRIYFTDPRYGGYDGAQEVEQIDQDGKPIEGVYRIDTDGSVTRIISHEVQRPNGIAVTDDGKHLIVADNHNGPEAGGNRILWRFDLLEDGSINTDSRTKLFDWKAERGPDGIAIGPDGHVYATAGFNFPSTLESANEFKAGVYVISLKGEEISFIPVPEDMITNCTFGGEKGNTLFITAGAKLWSIEIN
ncbi:MAG: SMP-30/gluconolactonase/LRE family protein [Verrucomicrobiales bacterium]|nr:SMP-30/gluconolactonase/LRE family protein [Verrucomicrobiales bacterium]